MTDMERSHPSLGDIDEESAALILELQRQDGELLRSAAKGKQREGGAPSDSEMALKLHMEELAMASATFSDHQIAKRLQAGIRVNADTPNRNLSLDPSVKPASKAATVLAVHPEGGNTVKDEDAELVEKMACVRVTGEHDGLQEGSVTGQEAESSASAASRPPPLRSCISCGDKYHSTDISQAPCQHEYCRQCIQQLFETSMLDESLFPPRCCKRPLPLDENIAFLPEELVKTFREKTVELTTSNRTYCHRTECLAFIPPSGYENGVAHCSDCDARTCVSCKGMSHKDDCPRDEGLQQVIELARGEGWQRCHNCRTMVELRTGCNHMTCRCGAQFCYQCGTPWIKKRSGEWEKSCRCAQWDERRLLERAAEVDARNRANRHATAADRARRIERVAQNLRQNHECNHERWLSLDGPRQCEECDDEMPLFIYRCQQCGVLACRRCRYNRL